MIANGNFETWTETLTTEAAIVSTSPTSWTLEAGDIDRNVRREATPKDILRGSFALRIDGEPVREGPVTISQAFTTSRLKPLKQYCCSFWYKRAGHPSSSESGSQAFTSSGSTTFSTILVECRGTGYSNLVEEKFINTDSLTDNWTLGHFFVMMPDVIPSDLKLTIEVDGLDEVESIWIDSLSFAPVIWHAGIGIVVVAGEKRFAKGDRFQFTATNDGGSNMQTFAREYWRIQLPSAHSSVATIDDALATA